MVHLGWTHTRRASVARCRGGPPAQGLTGSVLAALGAMALVILLATFTLPPVDEVRGMGGAVLLARNHSMRPDVEPGRTAVYTQAGPCSGPRGSSPSKQTAKG
jgi:hypothetical protein